MAAGMTGGAGSQQLPLDQWSTSPIGARGPNGELFDPNTGTFGRTGAQKGTDAGQALKALAEASGMPLLGSSSSASLSGMGSGGGTAPTIAYPDTGAANAAAFGRAKDQTGLNTRALLTAMENEMGANQMLGSGLQAGMTRDIIEHGAGQLNEVGREQAVSDAQQATRHADTAYQGAITQRGQDISVAQANAARQQQTLQGLLSVINSSGILY